jgi:hypothetical protein
MKKSTPSWTDVKARLRLTQLDRSDLLVLVQDLYAARKDNQAFLHVRLNLVGDLLNPYKATVDRWLWPDAFKNQNTSVVKAKKAIAEYKKASGSANGLAELMVFYCERAAGFSCDVGLADEGYFGALVRMFEQALKTIATLPGDQRPALWARLDAVRQQSHEIGYGVGDNMDVLFDARQGDA